LVWADEHGDGRRFSSWIEIVLDGDPDLVRLSGWRRLDRTSRPSGFMVSTSASNTPICRVVRVVYPSLKKHTSSRPRQGGVAAEGLSRR
jgi:hypothetical protein